MITVRSRCIALAAVLLLAVSTMAQQPDNRSANNSGNSLAQILANKGILTPAELATINQAPSATEANARLAKLLVDKGLINSKEYAAAVAPGASTEPAASSVALTPASSVTPDNTASNSSSSSSSNPQTPHLSKAVMQTSSGSQYPRNPTGAPPEPSGPPVIAAVAPVRVLPITIPKQAGMMPDIHLGSGANIKPYGFFKASAIEDTAGSGGPTFGDQDWPLPLLIGGDTGPTSDPQFHLKARSTRAGAQFEWVPQHSGFVITARVEADFEGDYTDVSNRNISSARSSQFDLRMAYMRLDHTIAGVPFFWEFGQDWTLISSSLPSLFETTGLGVAMGTLYERDPMFRTGFQLRYGSLRIQPEFAIVDPIDGSSSLTTDQRLRFGDRVGSDSNEPGLESRIVFQFPLSHNWRRVEPAQIIFSGHHAEMNEIIPHAAQLPTSVTCTALPCTIGPVFTSATTPNIGFTTTTTILGASNCTKASCTLEDIYPTGTQDEFPQNVWTTEVQLPTPWVTFVGKFYRGDNMRFFFGSQLNDAFPNLFTMKEVGTGVSESGRSIPFGCFGGTAVATAATTTINCNGNPVQSSVLQPVGGVGGFAEMSFPLSRIFHANPEGHNAGWVLHIQYGTDRDIAAEARNEANNGLARTDLDTVSITYKLNTWVSFVNEGSYIVTRAATADSKLFEGKKVSQAHDWRQEFGPIFTF